MQREIVGEIVEARGEQQDAAFADLLFEQQGRLVGQARDDARAGVVDFHGEIEFHAGPAIGFADGG